MISKENLVENFLFLFKGVNEGKVFGSVPDPRILITDPDPQNEHQELQIRILDPSHGCK